MDEKLQKELTWDKNRDYTADSMNHSSIEGLFIKFLENIEDENTKKQLYEALQK